jgi:hypothetical protein
MNVDALANQRNEGRQRVQLLEKCCGIVNSIWFELAIAYYKYLMGR